MRNNRLVSAGRLRYVGKKALGGINDPRRTGLGAAVSSSSSARSSGMNRGEFVGTARCVALLCGF